ncbi:MAG: response regulator, partial [Coriobacteriales bacterium]|nr:response regulator [Coriobacteriales bacterium]
MKNFLSRLVLVLLAFSTLAVLAISIYTGFMMNSVSTFLKEDIELRLIADARGAALIVTAEELEQLQSPEDKDTPLYASLKGRLIKFADDYNVMFVYFMRLTETNQAQFIIDNDLTEETVDLSTPPIAMEETPQLAFNGTAAATLFRSYSPGYDGILSAYAPIYDASGNVVAIAGVDISDDQILAVNDQIHLLTILLVIAIIIAIVAAVSNIILQLNKERNLKTQLNQQELMSDISQSFITNEQVHDLIPETLKRVGQFLGVERVLILRADEDTNESRPVYTWIAAEKCQPRESITGFNGIINSSFPKKLPPTGNVPTVYCGDITTEYNQRYKAFEIVGLQSFVWAPIYVDGGYWGILSIEELVRKRSWSESEAQLVGIASSAIAGAVARDVIEKEREQALDRAIQASQAKGDFLSNMSHEMRTPMNAIIGMTTIGKAAADLKRKDYCLSKIDEASSHLLGIINDVLDMSKIEANKFELCPVPFNYSQMLQRAVTVVIYKAVERGQILEVTTDPAIPPVLQGDDQRLTQVITNLLSNAVKFSPEGSSIYLRSKLMDASEGSVALQIEVQDKGIGISKEQQSRLFTSFEQAERGTSRQYGGTGLGLAISKRIVELMGGSIWIESKLGEGATFLFTVTVQVGTEEQLAAWREQQPESTDTSLAAQSILDDSVAAGTAQGVAVTQVAADDLAGYHALLAEDIEVNREIVMALLEPTGLGIDVAENGEEAVARFIADPDRYDIIFMDVQMPVMDG